MSHHDRYEPRKRHADFRNVRSCARAQRVTAHVRRLSRSSQQILTTTTESLVYALLYGPVRLDQLWRGVIW